MPVRNCSNIWKWKYMNYVVHFTGSTQICMHTSCVNVAIYFIIFKKISCRGSHRKQITQRSYTQPIPSIRINGASPPLNGTRQNATEPTGQLNGDISRNKYQAYSPTGKPWLPLPLILFQKKDYLACRIRFLVLYGIIVFALKIQESSFTRKNSPPMFTRTKPSLAGWWMSLSTYFTKKWKAIE